MENKHNEFEISFNDLTPECQERLLKYLDVETPEEADYDHKAVAVVVIEETEEGDEDIADIFVVNGYHTA